MTENLSPRMSSVIGQSAVVVGNVTGQGDLEIRGRVQGSVQLKGRLLIAESGTVLGPVEAVEIIVRGEVRGDLTSDEGIFIETPGRVEGNMDCPRVGIEAGARVRGVLRTGGELPAPAAKPDPAAKPSPAARTHPAVKPSKAEPAAPETDRTVPPREADRTPLPLDTDRPPPALRGETSPLLPLTDATRPRKRKRVRKSGKKAELSTTALSKAALSKAELSTTAPLVSVHRPAPLTVASPAPLAPPREMPLASPPPGAKGPALSAARKGPEGRRGPPKMPTFKKGAKGLKKP